MQPGLELTHTRNPQIPDWIELDKAIPGYLSMDAHDKMRYEDLYVLACHPEMLQQPPEDIGDLHALMYFIFQYNLTYPIVGGKRIEVLPFNPVNWTKEAGLSMLMSSSDCAPLLDELSKLLHLKSLYFCVLMLSLALIIRPNSQDITYHRFYFLLADMLTGDYEQPMLDDLKSKQNDLKEPWVINYLPDSGDVVIDAADSTVQDVRRYLLGNPTKLGLFKSPQSLRDVGPVEGAAGYLHSSGICLIL